ncbi:helix-turn-helix domain-containing protein [Actinomadura madurae]|uniref:helix-turn-helix domain-containing protein n=1 Tax=Actinomadura madurae TaxID=1993 RepID=UPI0020275153|nr:helix-turn-helix domain-containing protein [Actinomadura madurae]URM93995.1 helix-turn-helix domain-containing protein [Actinomadura madurae]
MNNAISTSSTPPLLFTITEACEALRVSRWQLYQLINNGRLRTVRINRRRFIAPDDLRKLIEELKEGGDDVR